MTPSADDGTGRKLGGVTFEIYPLAPPPLPPEKYTTDMACKAIYEDGYGIWFGPPHNFYAAGGWEGVPCAKWTVEWKDRFTGLMAVHIDSIEWNNIIRIPEDPVPEPENDPIEHEKWAHWKAFLAKLVEHEEAHESAFQDDMQVINDALICTTVYVFDGDDASIELALLEHIRASDVYQFHLNTSQAKVEAADEGHPDLQWFIE